MRRIFIFITLILSAASQVVFAQVAASPVLRAYATSETVYINKLSDNGLWAVASNVDANNSTLENYPYLFNVQTGSILSLLSEDEKLSSPDCGARDVTDDGKLIVGSYQGHLMKHMRQKQKFQDLKMQLKLIQLELKFLIKLIKLMEKAYLQMIIQLQKKINYLVSQVGRKLTKMHFQM